MSRETFKIDEFVNLEGEIWSKVESLPPSIEVSNFGRVREYVTNSSVMIVRLSKSSGYWHFSFKGKVYTVHRLVAEAFIPNPEGLSVVVHKNGDRLDNRVENLEWITHKESVSRGYTKSNATKARIYCKELDLVFSTLRVATFVTRIPQEILSRALKEGKKVEGLTFKYIDRDDPILSTHEELYIDFEEMFKIECEADSFEVVSNRFNQLINAK